MVVKDNKKRYIIFSDESGHWNEYEKVVNNSKEIYYVRCWIVIPNTNSAHFQNSNDIPDYSKVFFTIVRLKEFFLYERYIIRSRIESDLENIFIQLRENLREYMKDIKPAVISAVNKVLFLNIYEKYCWRNFLDALNIQGEEVDVVYLNKPQFTRKEYIRLLESIDNNFKDKIKILENPEKSNDSLGKRGLTIADKFSSLLFKIIHDEFDNSKDSKTLAFKNLYSQLIKRSEIVHGNILPGIEKVFKGDERNLRNLYNKLSRILNN